VADVVRTVPEFVYLVTVDNEWPVSVIADDHPTITAELVAAEVDRRAKSGNVCHGSQVKVWRARLTDVQKMDLMPAATVRPSLRVAEEP
jgi:hypothetical protein